MKSCIVRLFLFAIVTASTPRSSVPTSPKRERERRTECTLKDRIPLCRIPQLCLLPRELHPHQPSIVNPKSKKTYFGDNRTNIQERSFPSSLPPQILLLISPIPQRAKARGDVPSRHKILPISSCLLLELLGEETCRIWELVGEGQKLEIRAIEVGSIVLVRITAVDRTNVVSIGV